MCVAILKLTIGQSAEDPQDSAEFENVLLSQ